MENQITLNFYKENTRNLSSIEGQWPTEDIWWAHVEKEKSICIIGFALETEIENVPFMFWKMTEAKSH